MYCFLEYNRKKAVNYATKWAECRNPKYAVFLGPEADSASFVSQCLYAGCGCMNYGPVNNWYYIDNQRWSNSWADAKALKKFLLSNKKQGPVAEKTDEKDLSIGDIIIAEDNYKKTKCFIVTDTEEDILISSHSYSKNLMPLKNYDLKRIYYIKILGANKLKQL